VNYAGPVKIMLPILCTAKIYSVDLAAMLVI